MTTILMWMVVLLIQMLFYKKYRTLLIPIIAVIAVFGLRSLTVHIYNYGVTGYFMGNTYAQINTLTNVIYACDREDGEVFEDGSLEREFFERFYDEAETIEANYRYGGSTFAQQAAHLEGHHDELKFQVLEADTSAYFFGLGKVDYYQQSSMSDELAGRMLSKLLPACFGQWLYDYILLCVYGFIRSVAVVHPMLNWLAFVLYAVAIGLAVWQIFRGRQRKSMDVMLREGWQDAACVMGVALLFIAANVCATSITIMCLSRYMIYGFSLFYTALFLLVRAEYENIKF